MPQKPKITSAKVPWMISTVPWFQTSISSDGLIVAISFIAFFKLETAKQSTTASSSGISIIEKPSAFSPSGTIEGAPYRLVRISFEEPIYSAVEKGKDFPEEDFDWSAVPMDKSHFNSISQYLKAADRHWLETSTAPNSLVYEVEHSPLLEKLSVGSPDFKHIVLVGEDEFFEIVAKGWKWEPGQAVD